MANNLASHPPDWFTQQDNRFVSDLDAQGWFFALYVRAAANYVYNTEKASGQMDVDDIWGDFLASISVPRNRRTGPGFAAKVIEEIEPSQTSDLSRSPDYPLVRIHLQAADFLILEEFTRWLAEKRKEIAIPLKRTGPKRSGNLAITKKRFTTWSRQRILQIFDLTFWKMLFDRPESNATLATWVFHENRFSTRDPQKKFDYARDVLDNALDLIEALYYQSSSTPKK